MPIIDRETVVLVISDLEFGGAQRQVVELANNLDPTRFQAYVCVLADYHAHSPPPSPNPASDWS